MGTSTHLSASQKKNVLQHPEVWNPQLPSNMRSSTVFVGFFGYPPPPLPAIKRRHLMKF